MPSWCFLYFKEMTTYDDDLTYIFLLPFAIPKDNFLFIYINNKLFALLKRYLKISPRNEIDSILNSYANADIQDASLLLL